MANNADEKRSKILEIAKRRFSHYGMAKTTMAEIAKDLSFSKALLYYYFPDKNSLYAAVFQDIAEEAHANSVDAVQKSTNVDDAIEVILDISLDFKKKYFYILEYTAIYRKELPREVDEFIVSSIDEQIGLFQHIFEIGVKNGELRDDFDVRETARVLMYAIVGMRLSVVKDIKSDFMPDKSEFDDILSMQKKLAAIFLKGLKR